MAGPKRDVFSRVPGALPRNQNLADSLCLSLCFSHEVDARTQPRHIIRARLQVQISFIVVPTSSVHGTIQAPLLWKVSGRPVAHWNRRNRIC
jgi:hypothetical protein